MFSDEKNGVYLTKSGVFDEIWSKKRHKKVANGIRKTAYHMGMRTKKPT